MEMGPRIQTTEYNLEKSRTVLGLRPAELVFLSYILWLDQTVLHPYTIKGPSY